MKNQIKSLLLVAFMLGTVIPAWGQASTQGKEFWVSSTIVCSPDNDKNKRTPAPYIAISAEKACTVTITDYQGNSVLQTAAGGQVLQNVSVSAGSWTEFGTKVNSDPSKGPIQVYLAPAKWYPTQIDASDQVRTLAGQKNMYGLHITATEDVSVYVILSTLNSMDASNVLPVTAIGSEYYTQDYWPIVKSDWDNTVTMTTILATEDGTQVDIIPNGNTYDGHQSGTLYTVDLVKGQTYYLMSEADKQLTGTHIQAKSGKKIAVFNGVPLTNLPTDIAARDGLFEQSMPVEYWGTQFIVTRSLGKNGNLIGITATQRGTEIKVDGYSQAIIGEGDTYYIMLQGANDPNGNKPGTSPIDMVVTADAAFIETSCPCAVYNYDTGNGYKGKNESDTDGDPSSVWVSPIQQKISKITFGTCYTQKTKNHFLNVVTETATCNNTKLTAIYGATQLDKSSLLTWTPVPGNTKYSYARVQIGSEATKDYSVFRIENSKGFIATVYGNGDDESYAYSAGSAAVELGINVNGETFVEGYRSDSKFCMADTVRFDAGIGTDEVTRVDWNFGDGTTLSYGEPQVEHKYLSPGWYDVTAVLYGTQACSDKGEQHLGDVHFSFRVVKQDTLIGGAEYHCLPIDTLLDDPERRAYLLEHGETKIITPLLCYEPVYINYVRYGEHADTTITVEDYDSVTVNGVTYYQTPTQPVIYSVPNPKYPNCNLEITCNVHVIKCLKMAFANDPAEQHICPGEALPISYSKYDGDIDGAARLYIPGLLDELVNIDNNNVQNTTILLPTFTLQKPGIYQAKLIVPDQYCDTLEIPIDFTVYYPSDIFKRKFYNVLAMYNKEYNGGYEFKYYEWHLIRNGQDSIIGEGKDLSVYHQDIPFEQNDIVYVVLTDKNDFTLRSCEQEWTYVSDEFGESTYNAPAQKVLRNQRMYVRIGDRVYDMYGQRVE